MADQAAAFTGSIPDTYDRNLGPVIFIDYAIEMARLVAKSAPQRVLETAAGTGIVTRQLRDLLPAGTQIVATDLNPPMLDVARAKFRADEAIQFQPVDATSLPFPDAAFDAVVCQFGVMFYPDKPRSFREARRVLMPGGRYFFSVWDSQRYNPYGLVVSDVMRRLFAADPPTFLNAPFGYHQIDPIKDAVLEAGFVRLSAHVSGRRQAVPDPAAFARGMVFGSPLYDQILSRGSLAPEEVAKVLTAALSEAFGDPASMPLQAILFEALKA